MSRRIRFLAQNTNTTVEELELWLLSASYFCYAAQAGSGIRGNGIGEQSLLAASADAMASGCVGELELQLCNAGAQGSVEVYFASLISDSAEVTRLMLDGITNEIRSYLEYQRLNVDNVFAIGASGSGILHLERSGFEFCGLYRRTEDPVFRLSEADRSRSYRRGKQNYYRRVLGSGEWNWSEAVSSEQTAVMSVPPGPAIRIQDMRRQMGTWTKWGA